MNIIFDLDGTLIDASERMYQLFQDIVLQSTMTKIEYWNKKRDGINHQQILETEFPMIDFDNFQKAWISLIETEKYLKMDLCYSDTIKVLKKLSFHSGLYLLTARQLEENLVKELEELKIIQYFNQIFATTSKYSKKEMLRKVTQDYPNEFCSKDFFVSDMGKDIALGKEMGFITIAISHGFMAEKELKKYMPDYIITELSELINIYNMYRI